MRLDQAVDLCAASGRLGFVDLQKVRFHSKHLPVARRKHLNEQRNWLNRSRSQQWQLTFQQAQSESENKSQVVAARHVRVSIANTGQTPK